MNRRNGKGLLVMIMAVVLVAFGYWLVKAASHEPRIAVIHVEGVITGGRGQGGLFGDGGGTDFIIRQIQAARDDDEVKAVVVRVNSPGGSAPASQEVGEEIKKLRKTGKPTITSMGDMAASGGYWIAATTGKIYANPGTITGSIGVYIPYANWQELYGKIGIRTEKIKSGPHKDMLSPDRPITAEERAIVQAMVDDLYEQFVAVVAEGRGIDPARVRQLADGRVYTGRQAKAAGLVDEMGTLEDALIEAAKLAGIPGKPKTREYTRPGFWESLFGMESNSPGMGTAMIRQLVKAVLNEKAELSGASPGFDPARMR